MLVPMDVACWVSWGEGIETPHWTGSYWRHLSSPIYKTFCHLFVYNYTLDDDLECAMDYEVSLPLKCFLSNYNMIQTVVFSLLLNPDLVSVLHFFSDEIPETGGCTTKSLYNSLFWNYRCDITFHSEAC